MRVVTLYGGSFDPVHLAHIAVIDLVAKHIQPDVLVVLPCKIPAHKAALVAADADRVAMLRLALAGREDVNIDTRELDQHRVSYTFNTLSQMRDELAADVSLNFVIGEDSWRQFVTWYRWRDILQLANLIVVPRAETRISKTNEAINETTNEAIEARCELECYAEQHLVSGDTLSIHKQGKIVMLPAEEMDISSSEVRRTAAQGGAVEHWVPATVAEYITSKRLYQSPCYQQQ